MFTARQDVPGDGVRDGGKDPVELTKHRTAIVQQTRNSKQISTNEVGHLSSMQLRVRMAKGSG